MRNTPGGSLARCLLPACVLVPVVLGWLQLEGRRLGFYGETAAVVIFAVFHILVLIAVTGWSVRSMNRLESAEAKSRKMKNEFMSMASHELQTPLAIIKESISIVEDGKAGPLGPEQKHFLGMAKNNVERLARLLHNVLNYQRLDTGRVEMRIEPHDLGVLVGEIAREFKLTAKQKGVAIDVEASADLPLVPFDKDKIVQVLTHYLTNALKFGGNRITVKAEMRNGAARVSVADEGSGIGTEDAKKIFNGFAQIRAVGDGTGLGLAISKKIVEAHGGTVGVDSKLGQGSVFHFDLPLKKGKTAAGMERSPKE